MFKARYYKADGKKGRARELPASLFDGVINTAVLHQAVKVHLANQRQGTHSAKTRSEVSGGNSKPWKQKGTGRARQGSTRAVQWEGGGIAFPPIPHSWRQKMPKKQRALAHRSALNARAGEDRVILVDDFAFDAPGTKRLRAFLKSVEVSGKTLILTNGVKENVYLSARNVPGLSVMPFGSESAYDVLNANIVVIERSAVDALPSTAAAGEESEDA